MSQPTISVAIATYNEQDNIKRCLDSVTKWVDEIVVVDGTSSDNTVGIVKKFPHLKLVSTTNKIIFHINKQKAIDLCRSDWILQLDADEVVTPELRDEILATIRQPSKYTGYWINRRNFFLGRFLTKGGVYPDPTIRLYLRGQGRLPCKDVHEQAVVDGPVGQLKHDLLHYADPNFDRFLLRNHRYSSLLARQITNPGFLDYFVFKPIFTFFSLYLRHRGYVDGFPGFVFAFYSALRFPSAYVKYWESHHVQKL